ncbi:hypothetical protein SAMN05421806_11354 [Streptomyces indicus]|uniref:Uncharacterized protein n=1 Tax=Streptomyces indicus TaxID=417292 RepID=A0A1G9FDF4_9ACTN|nr:hypothetical protein SAMN05421806_11354 [Streptomyces indicus]
MRRVTTTGPDGAPTGPHPFCGTQLREETA